MPVGDKYRPLPPLPRAYMQSLLVEQHPELTEEERQRVRAILWTWTYRPQRRRHNWRRRLCREVAIALGWRGRWTRHPPPPPDLCYIIAWAGGLTDGRLYGPDGKSRPAPDWLIRAAVADRLREYRERRGFSQAKAGPAIHRTGRTIRNWEKGQTWPGIVELHRLAAAYGCTVNDFFT